MRSRLTAIVFGFALAAALTPAAPAHAAHTALDLNDDIIYKLSGRTLTVSLGMQTPETTTAKLSGKRVRFVCSRTLTERRPPNTLTRWRAGARTMKVKLPRRVKDPLACGLESVKPSADISYAFFRTLG